MPRGKPRSKTAVVDGLVSELKKLRQLFQARENMPELKELFDKEASKSLTKVKTGIKILSTKSKRIRKPAKKVKKKAAKKSTPSAEGTRMAKAP
jgi:hypothetical protein